MRTPLLTYEELQWVVTLMFALLLLVSAALLSVPVDERKTNERKGNVTYCPLHRCPRDKCQDQHD